MELTRHLYIAWNDDSDQAAFGLEAVQNAQQICILPLSA
jgi:hypothetical protein